MKTLNNLYTEKRPELQKRIEAANSNSEIIAILQSELQQLADIKGEYIGNLTKPQARIALSMLEAFRSSFIMLEKGQKPVPETDQYMSDTHEEPSSSLEGVFGGMAGGAIGGMVGGAIGGLPGGALGAVLGGGVSTAVTKSGIFAKPSEDNISRSTARSLEIKQPEATLDKKEILRYLEQSFDVIDQTVTEYGRVSEPVVHKPKIEDHPEVLKFIQDLMGEIQGFENDLPPIFQARLREVSSILRKYGIRSQVYQNDASEEVKALFEYEPSFDDTLQNYTMLTPALLKDGKLLLAGRVLEPSVK